MDTLIEKNQVTDRWYPQSIETYKLGIKIPYDTEENRRLNSNFSYSMQYIEYLEKQLAELKLSGVLLTMIYKSYIITGMGIVELLFTYLLKSTGKWNKTEWKEVTCLKSNPFVYDGKNVKSETILYEKVSEYEMRMDLDSMIKKIEKRHLLTIDHNVFPALKLLRELRNRVHLQTGENAYDHDYNNFGFEEIQMMRRILYSVLTTPELCNRAKVFDFIIDIYNSHNN